MSAAFARREQERRGLDDKVEILTGGTDPADEVHPEVVEVMKELDIDISDRIPQKVSTEEMNECDVVTTMGCSTLELDANVEVRDWALEDPHGKDVETVREICSEVEQLVNDLFDEYFPET
jgi:protein-tyrosine-phosphatase